MRVATETYRRASVTLVAVRVENDAAHARRVRLANRCDGAVWPPRAQGLPAPGWDDGGWEGVLDASETRPLGYATPGDPTDPAVEVAWAERAAERSETAYGASGTTANRAAERSETANRTSGALSEFGDPRPPRDAVAPPATDLPEGVREWLSAVSGRVDAGVVEEGDRETVRALAARASALRERVDE